MADEVAATVLIAAARGTYGTFNVPSTRQTFDWGANAVASGTQNIGTSAETLGMGDVSTAGFFFCRNTDATNYVEIGTGTGGSFVAFLRLDPGEFALGSLSTAAPTAKAHTAAVDLQYTILARS